jgi:hypothetical protein
MRTPSWLVPSLALAGALAAPGSASAKPFDRDRPAPQVHEGAPPRGAIAAPLALGAATDGRGDTDVADRHAWRDPAARTHRPDNQLGQERHFQLPIATAILLRVAHGDGDENVSPPDPRPPVASGGGSSRPDSYLGQPSHFQLPIKNDILMKLAGGEVRDAASPSLRGHAVHQGREARVYPNRYGQYGSHAPLPVQLPSWMMTLLEGGVSIPADDPKLDRTPRVPSRATRPSDPSAPPEQFSRQR